MSHIVGADLAEPQGNDVDFPSFVQEGIRFIMPKISTGAISKCPTFNRNYDEGRKNGIDIPAVYHWLSTQSTAKTQAANAVQSLGSRVRDPGLRIAVDFEDQGFAKMSAAQAIATCEVFVHEAESKSGNECLIYTGAYFAPWAAGGDSEFLSKRALWHAAYPLWGRWKTGGHTRAEYEAFLAALPPDLKIAGPWARRGLKASIYQCDGDGGLYLPQGIDGDFNIFLGNELDYARFMATGAQPLHPPMFLPTILNIQTLLLKLGFYKGALDGLAGPLTRAAVVAFQAAHSLVADGVVGRNTRAELEAAWDPDTEKAS